MPKDFTGVERRSCNNEDVVYRAFELLFNVLIIFVIDTSKRSAVFPKGSTNPLFDTPSNRLGVPNPVS